MKNARGAILWVGAGGAATRDVLEDAAAAFGLTVRLCNHAEALAKLQAQRCELVGIELDGEPAQALELVRKIRERIPRLTIHAASSDSGINVIREALESGASEVLSLPLTASELTKALAKFTQRGASSSERGLAGDVITVCGARGGLGVTTIAVNLAVRLAALTRSEVALVDLDLQRGDVAAFLNMTPLQSIATIAAARTEGEVDEVYLLNTMTRYRSGVHVLPAPAQIEEAETVSDQDVIFTLGLLRTQFRYTIVDTPRTITAAALPALEHADRILIMADLSVPGVRAAQRLFELLERLGVSVRPDLLVAETHPGPVTLKDATRTVGADAALVIPADPAASTAMNEGAPLNGARATALTRAVTQLAVAVAGLEKMPRPRRGGLFRRIFGEETSR